MSKVEIVVTGCFNLLHPGHLYFLHKAARLGDALTVFLDSDSRNKQLKKEKCLFSWQERHDALSCIKSVNHIVKFESEKTLEVYLNEGITQTSKQFLFVKARDYDISTIDPYVLKILDDKKVSIAFVPYLEKYSTTKIFETIKNLEIKNE